MPKCALCGAKLPLVDMRAKYRDGKRICQRCAGISELLTTSEVLSKWATWDEVEERERQLNITCNWTGRDWEGIGRAEPTSMEAKPLQPQVETVRCPRYFLSRFGGVILAFIGLFITVFTIYQYPFLRIYQSWIWLFSIIPAALLQKAFHQWRMDRKVARLSQMSCPMCNSRRLQSFLGGPEGDFFICTDCSFKGRI